MSMSTDKHTRKGESQTDSSEVLPEIRLVVSANVRIIDKTGTLVEAESIAEAIRKIRRRHHDDLPLVTLHDDHHHDKLFTRSSYLISPERILPVETEQLSRRPDYWLQYHSFTLQDPQVPDHEPKKVKSGALLQIATTAADTSNQPVRLQSYLLGFAKPVFNPGDGSAMNQTETEEPSSVLDDLDGQFFNHQETSPPPPPPVAEEDQTESLVDQPEDDGYDESTQDETENYQDWESEPEVEEFGVAELPGFPEPTSIDASTDDYDPDGPPSESTELVPKGNDPEQTQTSFFRKHQRTATIGVIATLFCAGVVVLYQMMFSGTATPEATTGAPEWVSQAPAVSEAGESLTAEYGQELWELDAETAENLSWFGAGAAYIDPDDGDLVLVDHLTGEEIGSTPLNSPVEYTSEFMAGEVSAVGARTEEGFRAITADGETQSWSLDESDILRVSGSTPMVTTEDGETFALVVGEDDPVEVTGNPQLHSAAIDSETLIQVAAGEPTVVTIPMTNDADHESAEINLETPEEGAEFIQHLTVGHGHTLTVWEHQDQQYLLVHSLQDAGQLTAAVEAPDEVSAWAIGRGMELAIVGEHAFDLNTGELVTTSEAGPLVSALGPAAVTDGETRQFIIDDTSYTEDQRIIGYTGAGTALVRMPDGSVRGLGESAGQI